MKSEQAHWWTRAAQTLSRSGLLWLALTVVALSSVAGPGIGVATQARLVAPSSIGNTARVKANRPGAPTIVPGELSRAAPHRAQNPEVAGKRVLAGGTPVALIAVGVALSAPARSDRAARAAIADTPASTPSAFDARAPPRIA